MGQNHLSVSPYIRALSLQVKDLHGSLKLGLQPHNLCKEAIQRGMLWVCSREEPSKLQGLENL